MDFVLALADPKQAWWQMLIMLLWNALIPIIAAVVLSLIGVAINRWKIKLEKEDVEKYVDQGIDYAEQKLKTKLADGKEPKDKNAERMKMAMGFIEPILKSTGLIKWVSGKLEDLIESRLGKKNAEKK